LIRAIAFDLDDTLLDTTGCLAPAANREAARALVDAGLDVPLDVVERRRWRISRRTPAGEVDEILCRQLGDPRPAVAAAGRRAFFQRGSRLRRRSLQLFPGVRALLARLTREHRIFLVTWGDPATQRTKIRLLRLGPSFRDVVVVDRRERLDKTRALEGLLLRHHIPAAELLVVGDGWSQEIAAGSRLGAPTCWISNGRPIPRWPPLRPHAVVPSVAHLPRVLTRLDRTPPLTPP